MNIPKAIKSVLFSLSLLYVLVSGFGQAAMGTMPMSGTPTCVMLGHTNTVCPMSVTAHVSAWERLFLGLPARTATLPGLFIAVWLFAGTGSQLNGLKKKNGPHGWSGKDPNIPCNLITRLISKGILQPKVY